MSDVISYNVFSSYTVVILRYQYLEIIVFQIIEA